MTPLAVLDPALGKTGAHNRGFAQLLAKQGFEPGSVGIWCNTSIADDLQTELASHDVAVAPMFTVDFYQLTTKTGGIADHWSWIHGLAKEYRRALDDVLSHWSDGEVRVLYHTLSWEHAAALAQAIGTLGSRGRRLRHLVLLMYWPGVDAGGTLLDTRKYMNFRLAFRSLSALDGVSLYAGCSEYAAAYAHLLEWSHPLPVHPCFLGDWRERPSAWERWRQQELLYLGEIKQDKGFLALPEKLSALLSALNRNPDHRYLIQFVNVRNEAARAVLDSLQTIASQHPEVELHHGFWPDEKLHAVLSESSVLHLDYDRDLYAHKTSGLLWMAAWYRLAVALPRDTWLAREAARLGVPVIDPASGEARVDHAAYDRDYFTTIFTPFWDWLEQVSGGGEAGIGVSAPGGTDIVMFWKQNDSTLYGRRCDMVAQYLASRPDVRRVILVDAPIDEARLATLGACDSDTRQDRWVHARMLAKQSGMLDTDKLVHAGFVYPANGLDEGPDGGRFPIDEYAAFLDALLAREGVVASESVFWVYPRDFNMPALLSRFAPARVVVDIVDDHRAWPGVDEGMKQRLTRNYSQLLDLADLAFANCEPVQLAMRGFHSDVRLVPNGCDEAAPASTRMRESRTGGRPTLGFVGNLESKIDLVLLEALAKRFPSSDIVLIGSTHANPRALELLRYPNVRMPGVVPYPELGRWLSRFDVGLIPHLATELTRHMNPLKAYVYLSWGIPVVATAVPNIDTDTDLICVASTHEEFIERVEDLLEGRRPPARAFEEYVRENCWAARLKPHVDELLCAHLAGKRA